ERLELVEQEGVSAICVSAIPPGAIAPARYLCKRLRMQFPAMRIIVGIWQTNADLVRLKQRIGPALADGIATTLSQAVELIGPLTPQDHQPEPAPPESGSQNRHDQSPAAHPG